ncbi:MAG: hypothetical protein DSY40_01975 [Nautilia sp.]|nr:MAG: hypothetical protein DSY40_01975 [Nautilia sp.]
MKRGFGLITVLLIMVLVSFLLMLVLKVAAMGIKHTSYSYKKERASLFLRSSIENTILAIEAYERNSSSKCLKQINFVSGSNRNGGNFEANITILRYYCYDMSKCPNCDIAKKIDSRDEHGNVLIKAVVQSTDKDEPVRITNISIQRP